MLQKLKGELLREDYINGVGVNFCFSWYDLSNLKIRKNIV